MGRHVASDFDGILQRQLIELLNRRREYLNMTMAELSRRSGVPYVTVRRTLRDSSDRHVSVALLDALAYALDAQFNVRLVNR